MNVQLCIECNQPFTKKRDNQKYCSIKCYKKEWTREKYINDPKFKESARRRMREFSNRRKLQGNCVNCGKPTNGNGILCLGCGEKHKIQLIEQNKRYFSKVIKRRLDIINRLGGKCIKCEYKGTALSFHHLTGEKDNSRWDRSKNFDELVDKGAIQLLCANCHYEIHHTDLGERIT